MKRNKIIGKKKSLSILGKNKFVLYSSRIKEMRRNEKEKLFLVNGKIKKR